MRVRPAGYGQFVLAPVLTGLILVAAAIGTLARGGTVVLALGISVVIGLVTSALDRNTFEVVALSSLPLLTVIIAGTIRATAANIRELRNQRTPDERQATMRLRRERRERLLAAHAEGHDLAA